LADLLGGDAAENAMCLRRIFAGEDRGPRREAVLLNAAAALFVAGRVESIQEGWTRASEVLDSGAVARKLAELTRP
jgi:anthranilate phosphoribosyltransferase